MLRVLRYPLAAAAVLSLASLSFAGNPSDVANFTDVGYGAGGYGQITGLAWGARGGSNYLFVCNRAGNIYVIKNNSTQQVLLTTVTPLYTSAGEAGLESIITDVDFGGSNPYVWIYVTETSGSPGASRVYRYTFADSGTAMSLSGKAAVGPVMPNHGQNHNGGGITQDSSGRIYAGVGNCNNGINEGGNRLPGSTTPNPNVLTSLGSKVVRFNRDGSAAGGSNYIGSTNPTTRYIFAKGFRNPFGLRIRPGGNQLWMYEVGDGYEQIFHVTENGDQGWPTENNQSTTNGLLIPKYAYQTGGSLGNCLTRGTFYNGTAFPAQYQGNLFFCEYAQSRIFRAQMNGDSVVSGSVAAFVTSAGNPTDIVVGPDGALYYGSSSSGQVRRLYYSGSTPPAITAAPQNRTVTEGQTATFNVAATGTSLSYQWQSMPPGGAFANITGATSASYTTPATTVGMSGTQYRVVVSNAAGSVTSTAATLTVNYAAPTITGQPANQSVVAPATATFSVTATGTNRTYQWQSMPPGGAFANIAGATGASYTTPATATGMSGTQYRVIVTNPGGSVTSAAATLTVTAGATPPSITAQPGNQTVTAPATATFSVTATGTSLSYQWQSMPPGGAFANISGATGASYTTPATATGMSGTQYRVVVTNGAGSVTSAAATLTVNGAPAATPVISPSGGTYSGPVTVRITTATAGATIRYTTNNTAPTGSSPAYGGPFAVSATATVRAIATMAGMTNSAEASAAFTVTGNAAYGIPYRDPATGINIPTVQAGLPPTLSATGLFQSPVSAMNPNPAMIPFGMITPLWSDAAQKKRWIVLPGTQRISFSSTGEWTFPAGTILVKHFDLPINDTNASQLKRLETRVFYIDQAGGTSYGATYKWRADNTEADLMTNATAPVDEVQTITTATGTRSQTWSYPSRENCMTCHNSAAGTVLGPKTRQLNGPYYYPSGVTDNQLRTWNYLRMFTTVLNESSIPGYSKLAAVDDVNSTLEQRSRSYLDSNCGNCHRPGAPSGRAQWDGRYDTALASTGIIDAPVLADNPLGLANPRILASSDPANSMLLQRMLTTGGARMPTIASHVVDDEATITITAWINTLPASPGSGPPAGPSSSSDSGGGWGCGLTGAEAALALVLLALARRRFSERDRR
jgi:uncharacterized repeat protein (TIGR03806 family)